MAATSANPAEEESAGTGSFRAQPPARQRVADYVFESLARAILKHELKPGEPLATQRDLAKQFNVSALVVRQAIHRLEDLGLVRVRQGSSTIVLDPEESTDIRLIQLQFELSVLGPGLATAALELQSLFLVPLLALAERRITSEELAVLNYLIDSLPPEPSLEQSNQFRVQFFRQVAKATRNELHQQQVRWWGSMARELERRGHAMRAPVRKLNVDFFRQLVRALGEGQGTPQLYLELTRPLLDWADAQRGYGKDAAKSDPSKTGRAGRARARSDENPEE
jgi:DNA-binding FadR family transcriptional regulator